MEGHTFVPLKTEKYIDPLKWEEGLSDRKKASVIGIHWTENGPLGRVETGPEMRLRDLEICNLISDTHIYTANKPT